MNFVLVLSVLLFVCISSNLATDLIVGTSYNARLAYQHKAEYIAIPFKKRIKEVFYSDDAQQIIKGIVARDIDHTDGTAIITAGGIGSTFANIRLKSARGSGLNYLVEIYV